MMILIFALGRNIGFLCVLVGCMFALYWYIWSITVVMEVVKQQRVSLMFSPGHKIKWEFIIYRRNVIGGGLKQ